MSAFIPCSQVEAVQPAYHDRPGLSAGRGGEADSLVPVPDGDVKEIEEGSRRDDPGEILPWVTQSEGDRDHTVHGVGRHIEDYVGTDRRVRGRVYTMG